MARDLTFTILVNKTPGEVFAAINNVGDWWQGEIQGNSKKLNDEFTYRYEDIHVSTQKIIEFIPGKKVVWLVTDSSLNFIDDKTEWNGTKISFEISGNNGQTQLVFTHHGLVPEIECYNDCSNAWSQLVQQSLFSLITTGKGKKVF